MTSYFFEQDDKKGKIINKNLLESDAKTWAKSFLDKTKKDKPLSSSQLRKFHFEIKTIEERLKNHDNPDDEFFKVLPLVKLVKSKVAYACRTPGKERKVPETFKNYIDTMINNIHDYEDFKAFALCFEAVVGYFYGEGGK